MSFTPQLYIGIGETQAFYTLRETYLHEWHSGNCSVVNGAFQGTVNREVRSFHHFNLSQDLDEAFAKATVCAERMCLKLDSTKESLACQMRDIKRATAEEMKARIKAAEEQQAEWEAARHAANAERVARIHAGFFVYGPYKDEEFKNAPRDYLSWIMDSVEKFEPESVLRMTAESMLRLVPHLALPKPHPEMVVGKEKQRLVFNATVLRIGVFGRPSFNGYGMDTVYITTMATKEGACVICFSTSFGRGLEAGDELKFKATVKSHGEYQGQVQTTVQRVTVLEEKKAEFVDANTTIRTRGVGGYTN